MERAERAGDYWADPPIGSHRALCVVAHSPLIARCHGSRNPAVSGRVTLRSDLDDEHAMASPKVPQARPVRESFDLHKQRSSFSNCCTMVWVGRWPARRLGIGVREMKRAIAANAGFRHAVKQIEEVRAERMFALLYDAALNGDMKAAQFLLARHDRQTEQAQSPARRLVLNEARRPSAGWLGAATSGPLHLEVAAARRQGFRARRFRPRRQCSRGRDVGGVSAVSGCRPFSRSEAGKPGTDKTRSGWRLNRVQVGGRHRRCRIDRTPRGDDPQHELEMDHAAGHHEHVEDFVGLNHSWPEDRPAKDVDDRPHAVEDAADHDRGGAAERSISGRARGSR